MQLQIFRKADNLRNISEFPEHGNTCVDDLYRLPVHHILLPCSSGNPVHEEKQKGCHDKEAHYDRDDYQHELRIDDRAAAQAQRGNDQKDQDGSFVIPLFI